MTEALFTRNTHKKFPRFIRGEGIYLYDDTGRQFIDGSSGTVITNIGHGRSEVAEVMARQAEKLAFLSPVIAVNEPSEQLAQKLVDLVSPTFTRCWYQTSGSEAIEAAIKLARVAHINAGREGKYQVISCWQSYHGSTLGSLSATGHTPRRSPFQPLLLPFPHIPPANCYRCPFDKKPDVCGIQCAHALEREIRHANPATISAFISEPISGSGGGVTVPPQGYFEVIRDICDRYDVFWIMDEIMTGFWRTGPTFGFQHWSAAPDVLAFAKGVTAGYAALAGLLVREKLYELIDRAMGSFNSAGTLAGNPVSCAVGLKVLEIQEREKIPERVAELGNYFQHQLDHLRAINIVGDVRGKGFMAAVEFVQDQKTAKPFPPKLGVYQKVVQAAYKRNLMIYGSSGIIDGVEGDIVMITPPLTISKDEINALVERLGGAIKDVSDQLKD
ncbi:MAG: aminotransferase family protein [Syntrophales bacterium]